MNHCGICAKPTDNQLCVTCSEKLGLAGPPPERAPQPCARCGHGEFVHALARQLTIHPGSETSVPMVTQSAVTYMPRLDKALFGDKVKGVLGPDERMPIGILDMYVCRKCGFTEWYARQPDSIPIGPEFATERVTLR
jgi:hypothetical protein